MNILQQMLKDSVSVYCALDLFNSGLDSLSITNKVEETLNSNIILAKNKSKISN